MDSNKLSKYKGWVLNNLTMNTIEYEFQPYKLKLYDIDDINDFNNEYYLDKTIRCLVFRGIIINLSFN